MNVIFCIQCNNDIFGTFDQVVRLDVKDRVVYLQNGKSVTYDKCLLATGTVCHRSQHSKDAQ